MNNSILFASTKEKIFLFNLKGMKILAKIPSENHLGRIALSPNGISYPYLLYSTSLERGELIIFDTNRLEVAHTLRCHRTTIMKVAINYSGSLAATCSTNGQMIRVFVIPTGEKLYTFNKAGASPSKNLSS